MLYSKYTGPVLCFATILSLSSPTVSKADVPCEQVSNNVFRTTHIKNTDYSRLVLAARLSRMTYQEAKNHLEAGVTIPIYGVPVSPNMSEDDFHKFQERVKSSIDVDQIISHENEILVSEGDHEILDAWSACMDKFFGITAILKDQGHETVRLALHYTPPPMSTAAPIVQEYTLTGGTVVGGKSIIAAGSKEIGTNADRLVTIKRAASNVPIYFVLNTTNVGDASSYLPPRYVPPPQPVFTTISIPFIPLGNGFFYDGARVCTEWGNDLVCGTGVNPFVSKTFNVSAENISPKGYKVYIEAAIASGNRPVTININGDLIPGALNGVTTGAWNKVQKIYVTEIVSDHIHSGDNTVVVSTNGDLPHLRSVQLEPIK